MATYFGTLILITAAVVGLSWVLSWMATRLAIGVAESRRIVADVNHRSSHRVPTPRLGGIGLTVGLLVGCTIVALGLIAPQAVPLLIRPTAAMMTLPLLAVLVGGILGAFVLGLWDDMANPPAVAKLVGQLLLAIVPPVLGWRLERLHLPGMDSVLNLPVEVGVALTAAWILAMMNAVNFMDGINGIAGRFGQVVAGATFLAVFQLQGAQVLMVLCMGLMGGCGGFLHWNVPRARTFMGDCGSQTLGFFIAMMGVHLANLPTTHPLPFVGFLIIVSPFLFDVGITLVKRLLEGRNVMKAHREHLYQRYLIANGEDHDRALWFFEAHHLVVSFIGILYLFMFYRPSDGTAQGIALGATALVLGHYAWRVLAAEDRQSLVVT